eukprot:785929-Pyramimonas_sp.AAC.1
MKQRYRGKPRCLIFGSLKTLAPSCRGWRTVSNLFQFGNVVTIDIAWEGSFVTAVLLQPSAAPALEG